MGKQHFILLAMACLAYSTALGSIPIAAQEPDHLLLVEMQRLDLSDQTPSEHIRIQLEFANQRVRLKNYLGSGCDIGS